MFFKHVILTLQRY